MRPSPCRNFTESAIIAAPSSSVVCSASSTWYSELFATMHTAAVLRLDQVAQRRVVVDLAPRATRRTERDERRGVEAQLGGGAGEELDVLRIGTGPAALDVVDAEEVELLGDAQLVVDRRGDALDLETVSQCGVEDFDRAHELLPRNEEAARWGGLTNTWGGHVFYEMMMMEAVSM